MFDKVKKKGPNFIEQIIDGDIARGFENKDLRFRFPPEPNGYLHIGHLKAICLNFNLGEKYNAPVNLRFDDTNPEKEAKEYVDAIKNDIKWLEFEWDKECYASDYFDKLYDWAITLIEKDLAYVDSQSSDEIASQKGTPTKEGKASPFRNREKEESLKIFKEMFEGVHDSGKHVLRAKIDMSSPNMLMRDPVLYRVMNVHHHRTADKWKVYPMYDWTHGESDYIEQVSHSLCTLEFEPHRELYDWFLDAISPLKGIRPKQREFSRLNLSYTITSKRKLALLVEENIVDGWDDPRMPTISGLRKRGYTPESLKNFALTVGVSKRENIIDASLLEFCIRTHLNQVAPRAMAVMDPIKIKLINYENEGGEKINFDINPQQKELGTREINFSKELYIENEDFQENPEDGFFRLSLGEEVRLKNAYIIKAVDIVKNKKGRVIEVLCEYDSKSRSGSNTPESNRKVKGTIHWVSATDSVKAKVNIYDRLFKVPEPGKENDLINEVNQNSLEVKEAFVEPYLAESLEAQQFQFQRLGYFVRTDNKKTLEFNKTVGLRDSWKK
ncbi:glutamine--tRNA ligase/YqeY domain fusion protein [Flavobacteriaceae bacterium]|nr:glutamine--tRNA ligase/YqeY domain fusion protein [Flavobacteriaceae bacterium]MDC1010546.1 glutamine--tRNA ligase/YqeY domain fusion protein [Flavobacteriaceae bacterium]MDC3219074.1 glutamine--tRNA ligase/YqeY domain fusion protein [Flavobacteriaceae bacterium]